MFILQRIDEPPKPDTAPQKTTSTRTTKTGNLKTKSIAAAAGGAGAAGGAASGKAAAATSAAALKREAQRKQLMEMKRQRREALAAAKNQTACDGDSAGAAGEGVEAASTNNNAELDVAVATVASATIGDTVNIAVKNSS